ncbi:MAG: hypothetical protein LAQ69_32970 [Acidobacteriia bacterium]|nr:hypothetical protein [Terriglobia bacterium]
MTDSRTPYQDARVATLKLLDYCRSNEWAGYDPYDALNSGLFNALPFLNSRIPRLVLTQALKKSPINVRSLLRIPKTQNPKGLALFLSAFIRLSKIGVEHQQELISLMIERLGALRSPGVSYWCWGYSFPWQTRTILVPAGAPNLVCTSFVANALLDVYDDCGDSRCLSMAVSAAEYILNELYWTSGDAVAGFSYPLPTRRAQIHNANFLAAALLCRVHKRTGERKFLDPALKVARHSAAKQNADGSWYYGEEPSAGWIDNFHTGFNLCALRSLGDDLGTAEFKTCIERGFAFYRDHFFREDGVARYFHDRTYPIDVHSVAQSIITLATLKDLDPKNLPLAYQVLGWAMNHLRDARGCFYYRALRFCKIRTSYMRWSQAWMLLAMATLLSESENPAALSAADNPMAWVKV